MSEIIYDKEVELKKIMVPNFIIIFFLRKESKSPKKFEPGGSVTFCKWYYKFNSNVSLIFLLFLPCGWRGNSEFRENEL